MPVLLDDDTALMVFKALMRLPPTSGHVIIGLLQEQAKMLGDQGKLIQQLTGQVNSMSQTDQEFQTELAGMAADMAKQTTATNGLKVLVAGFAQKLADATAAAQAAGASPAELTALKSLHTDLIANTTAIVEAGTANTAAASEPPAPIVQTTTVDPTALGTAGATGADTTGGAAEGTTVA